jgi:hypothetical protein
MYNSTLFDMQTKTVNIIFFKVSVQFIILSDVTSTMGSHFIATFLAKHLTPVKTQKYAQYCDMNSWFCHFALILALIMSSRLHYYSHSIPVRVYV